MPTISPIEVSQLTTELAQLSCRLEDAKRAKEIAIETFELAEIAYIQLALAAKAKGVKVSGVEFMATNGIPMTSTLVDGTGANSVLDESQFSKRIGTRKWKLITKTVIDSVKLKAQIEAGVISMADVAICTRVGDKKSYARFTTKTATVTKVTKRTQVKI